MMPERHRPTADAYGSTIDARDLPRECKPPFRFTAVWTCKHRGWTIVVSRIEHDPLPHVVISGHAQDGKYQIHAARQESVTPASVRAWIDELLRIGNEAQS